MNWHWYEILFNLKNCWILHKTVSSIITRHGIDQSDTVKTEIDLHDHTHVSSRRIYILAYMSIDVKCDNGLTHWGNLRGLSMKTAWSHFVVKFVSVLRVTLLRACLFRGIALIPLTLSNLTLTMKPKHKWAVVNLWIIPLNALVQWRELTT